MIDAQCLKAPLRGIFSYVVNKKDNDIGKMANNIIFYGKYIIERGEYVSNKLKTTNKQMASLGIRKNETGDYKYINPDEKNESKYKPVKKEPK